jgi:alkylation response protein AidB-like acyl-CoA dehydrogenase
MEFVMLQFARHTRQQPREESAMPDFSLSPEIKELRAKTKAFMDEHIYPNEKKYYEDINTGNRWEPSKVIEQLKPKARAAGLWNLFLPDKGHGAGLPAPVLLDVRRFLVVDRAQVVQARGPQAVDGGAEPALSRAGEA